MVEKEDKAHAGKTLIFVASITLKNGRKIYARDYGKKGFPIWV